MSQESRYYPASMERPLTFEEINDEDFQNYVTNCSFYGMSPPVMSPPVMSTWAPPPPPALPIRRATDETKGMERKSFTLPPPYPTTPPAKCKCGCPPAPAKIRRRNLKVKIRY